MAEKVMFCMIPLSSVCFSIESYISGNIVNGSTTLICAMLYIPVYKILRRLRKRIIHKREGTNYHQQYISDTVFASFAGLVPIFYFST